MDYSKTHLGSFGVLCWDKAKWSFDQQNMNFMHKLIFFSLFADPIMHRDCPLDCKVYVGNLGSNGNKTDLERAFGYYGPLRSVWVARNPPGFAFVEFEDSRDATDAVRELDGRQGSTSMDCDIKLLCISVLHLPVVFLVQDVVWMPCESRAFQRREEKPCPRRSTIVEQASPRARWLQAPQPPY